MAEDLATAALIRALRRGRADVVTAEGEFQRGGSDAIQALLARQGLGSQSPGFQSELAERLRRRQGADLLEARDFEGGLANLQRRSSLQQIQGLTDAAARMGSILDAGRQRERSLRQTLDRIRAQQSENELLNTLGTVLGLGLTAAL